MLLYVTDEIETLLGLHQHFEGHGGYWHFWFIVFGSYRSCLNNVASEAIVDGAFMVSVINEGLYEFAASMRRCVCVCVCENSSIARMMLMCQIISSTVALIGSCIAYSL